MKKIISLMVVLVLMGSFALAENGQGSGNTGENETGSGSGQQGTALPPGLENALNQVQNQNARQMLEQNMNRFQERYQERLQNMEGLEVTEIDEETGAMKLKAKEGVRFLGFIKGKATKKFEIDADGNITEKHPWYKFMYAEDITEEEEE